ncbi:hypothetical protein AO1008_04166 [Aspergillus oryzae 100-8]|uniref:Uncharacterized protein n=1 Tax=Aspergillus oryzae (strain 3.042) TaxID=1160506 RepID=I8U9I7_ASPO3|nr:hypothetical protein Ao3042_05155 [Aspergillus oryzae 3.042]KDE78100.1 hypothetical protein AO1008_04166 [Aspergillus oryzae 100-8]|eukprot:EIT83600.1 hypothetical protein Ao3042_05155 [Aspergillus oryzae 3.042]
MHPSVFLPYHPTQWTDFSVLLPNSMHHGFLDQGYPASWGVNTAPTQPWWKDSGRLLYHSPVNFARCEAGTNLVADCVSPLQISSLLDLWSLSTIGDREAKRDRL